MIKIAVVITLTIFLTSCAGSKQLTVIKKYLNESSVENRSALMATSYRSYFGRKEGSWQNKSAALASFQNWDAALNPDVNILSYKRTGSTWNLRIVERNDFSKLLGYNGWRADVSITLNEQLQVEEFIFKPDTTKPSHQPLLKQAVTWLQLHHPKELEQIYQNNKLVRSAESARQWVELLKNWNEARRPVAK